MYEMKQEWEIYRDTGVKGAHQPERAILRELRSGDVLTMYRDTEYWQTRNEFTLKRDMVIGGKVFHISSVLQDEDTATSTPTEKLLSHIDLQLKKEAQGA